MVPSEDSPNASPALSGALRLAFYILLGALALVEVFVSFRGLKSPAGMEQAQLAREVARGNGWVTKCVRPGAWRQMLDAHPEGVDMAAFAATATPPLPALLLVPWFKLAEPWWDFDPAKNGVIYTPDRIVAGLGVLYLLLLVYFLHGLALRLFDERVAVVVAAAAGFCKPLWELAVSGSPRLLLGLLLVLALRLVLDVLERVERELPAAARLAVLGLLLAAMPLTHGMGVVWSAGLAGGVVLGLGQLGRQRVTWQVLVLTLVLPLLLIGAAWVARNHALTGDVLGAVRVTLRGLISGLGVEHTARSFSNATDGMALMQVLRGGGIRLVGQWEGIFGHLGLMVGAPLILLAWLHRFRRPVCQVMARLTGLLVVLSMVTMALIAPVTELMDEHNVYLILAPVMGIFGTAMITMAWSRLQPGARGYWAQWGHGLIVVGLTAMPLLVSLPDTLRAGFALRGRISQWPPYAADRVARLGTLLQPEEILMADAPWFTAWYADVTSIWLPVRRAELALMREAAEKSGHPVAGVVVTPVSAKSGSMVELLDGPWSDWLDVVFRGPVMAFDREIKTWEDFPYPVVVPLVGFSIGGGEGLGVLMAFYTDRARTLQSGK